MKIGILGAGVVAQTIARHVLPHGHQVIFSNSGNAELLEQVVKELGADASSGTPQQAANQSIVILAVPWQSVQAALFSIPDWRGRTLVDATNRIASLSPFSLGDTSGRTSSEIVADLAFGAKVVKAFSSVPMAWISDFTPFKPRTALFQSGDHEDANALIAELIEQIGFCAVNLGSLAIGGRLQQLGGPLGGIRLTFEDKFSL